MGGPRIALAAVLVIAAASCSDDGGSTATDTTTTTEEATPIEVVDMRGEAGEGNYPELELQVLDNTFDDGNLRIDPGVTIEWVNEGRVDHDIVPVAEDGPDFGVDRSDFAPGDAHEFRFVEPGVYPYYCSLHGSETAGMTGVVVVGDVPAELADAGPRPVPEGPPETVTVPTDAATIQEAVDSVPPGSLVLVEPGRYHEEVVITTDRIVLRGLDRDETVLDGAGELDNGVQVLADGVAIENLTALDYRVNGFFWNGITGYRGSYLTAVGNELYGVYAFASEKGVVDHSYASGASDAGFYVGECEPCDALFTDLVAERNQTGFSGTNASGGLSIVDSEWRQNRAGIVLSSLDSELLPPQHDALVAGNLVDGSGARNAPRRADGFLDLLYGLGIAVIGGIDDVVVANRVVDSPRGGIAVTPNPALQENFWPAKRNQVTGNAVRGSGLYDLALVALPNAGQNCFADNRWTTSAPAAIEDAVPCDGEGTGDVTTGAVDLAAYLELGAPPAPPDRKSIIPEQPEMPGAATAPPAPAEDFEIDVDPSTFQLPPP